MHQQRDVTYCETHTNTHTYTLTSIEYTAESLNKHHLGVDGRVGLCGCPLTGVRSTDDVMAYTSARLRLGGVCMPSLAPNDTSPLMSCADKAPQREDVRRCNSRRCRTITIS